ncbi:MAG: hypothetical protein WA137_12380 [Methanothrix sp.]
MITKKNSDEYASDDEWSVAFEHDLLMHYGTCIVQYHGQGELILRGGKKLGCKFEVGQMNNGDVIMLCDFSPSIQFLHDISDSSFEGTTLEGYKVTANKARPMNYLPEIPAGCRGSWESILWHDISVQIVEGDNASRINFGITNLEYSGTEGKIVSEGKKFRKINFCILPINIDEVINLSIIKLKDYDKIMRRLSTLKSIDVTCEIEATLSEDNGIDKLKEIIDNLCYLLSVARGTKIQWIYYNLSNNEGKLISRTHFSRITRPYCPLPVIDPSIEGRNETKVFIENAYPIYLKKREAYNLDHGFIDVYLEGKAEDNFLQTRGVKLAVAMEILKDVFLTTSDSSIKEFIIEEERFETFFTLICENIRGTLSGQIDNSALDRLCCRSNQKKLSCLNRASFRQAINDLCRSIKFRPENDLSLFIYCRDSLIHKGRFYCETATEKQKAFCKPLKGPEYEYFFLVDFLDKIILKFFNYSGVYISSQDLKFERKKLI